MKAHGGGDRRPLGPAYGELPGRLLPEPESGGAGALPPPGTPVDGGCACSIRSGVQYDPPVGAVLDVTTSPPFVLLALAAFARRFALRRGFAFDVDFGPDDDFVFAGEGFVCAGEEA
jgi:hypothetical protein